MTELYNMYMSRQMNNGIAFNPQNMTPVQRQQAMMQAMLNPAAFVKQCFPDIPDNIQYDSSRVLQYLQQTRNFSNQQIQTLLNQYPYPGR